MIIMILASVVNEEPDGAFDSRFHHHEHEDEHHLNRLVYYSLAIVPVLALLILLPNACYSMSRRRDKLD